MIGIKGLKIRNDNTISSPSRIDSVWDGLKLTAHRPPTADDMCGIHIALSMNDASFYSRHLFLVEGYGQIARHEAGFRAEHARIVAYIHAGDEIPNAVNENNIPVVRPTQIPEFIPELRIEDGRLADPLGLVFVEDRKEIRVEDENVLILCRADRVRVTRSSRIAIHAGAEVDTIWVKDGGKVSIFGNIDGAFIGSKLIETEDAEINELHLGFERYGPIGANIRHSRIEDMTIHGCSGRTILNIRSCEIGKLAISHGYVEKLALDLTDVEWLHLEGVAIKDLHGRSSKIGTIFALGSTVQNRRMRDTRIREIDHHEGDGIWY